MLDANTCRAAKTQNKRYVAVAFQLKGVSCCVFSQQEHLSRLQQLSFCPSCDAHLPRLVPEPMYAGSCYETASAGCSMYSDLPVPGATGRSRMKVRTPRGQMQPLKGPCLPGGPSMPCCAHHKLRPATLDVGLTDQLCVRAVRAQGSCASCAGHRHFCASTHTRVPGAFTVEGAPAASRFQPGFRGNLPTVPTDPVHSTLFRLGQIFHTLGWGSVGTS